MTFYLLRGNDEFVCEDLNVNMHNANACRILALLGYKRMTGVTVLPGLGSLPIAESGSTTAEDFEGRVLVALAIEPADEGRDWTQDDRMATGSRRAGRTEELLAELRRLAEAGKGTPGAVVCWA